jgi:hypothetical protein
MNAKKKYTKFLYLLLFCINFLYPNLNAMVMKNNNESPDYAVLSNEIQGNVAKKLAKKYNMHIFGLGSGLADRVNLLGLSFNLLGPLPKDQLREILVDCVEEYLTSINSNEAIRLFLKNYPFTPNEIEIELFLKDKKGYTILYPNISVATSKGGYLRYHMSDDSIGPYKSSEKETYEEALKIVRNNKEQ